MYFQADAESRRNQLMRDMAQLRLQVIFYEPLVDKTNDLFFAPIKELDQSGHLC